MNFVVFADWNCYRAIHFVLITRKHRYNPGQNTFQTDLRHAKLITSHFQAKMAYGFRMACGE